MAQVVLNQKGTLLVNGNDLNEITSISRAANGQVQIAVAAMAPLGQTVSSGSATLKLDADCEATLAAAQAA